MIAVLTREETRRWLGARKLAGADDRVALSSMTLVASHRIPPDSGVKTALSRHLVSLVFESDLRLAFVDSRGARHDEKIDVYLETGDGGRVTITVRPDLNATWTHKSWPWGRTASGVTK